MPEFDEQQTKIDINTFLWSRMPGDATLKDMEGIATGMLVLMRDYYAMREAIQVRNTGSAT